jgi:hypothetical protein
MVGERMVQFSGRRLRCAQHRRFDPVNGFGELVI